MSAELTKAVVLARGLGKRMRDGNAAAELSREQASAADTGLKTMIPVGRPFLDYILSGLADAGYRDICLVIGPEHHQIREYYSAQGLQRVALSFAIQAAPLGTADALVAAQAFADSDEFLVMNSDNYYPVAALRTLRGMHQPGTVLFDAASLVRNSNIPADRVRSFAYAEVRDGHLISLREKPDDDAHLKPDAMVSMNLWRLPPRIFDFCLTVPRSPRGEYELPLAINAAIGQGMRLRVERSQAGVLDLSRREDIPAVARLLANVEVKL